MQNPALAMRGVAGNLESSEGLQHSPAQSPSQAFDYAILSLEAAKIARNAVAVINEKMCSNIVGIGTELSAVKEKLEHGQFLKWLVAELNMTPRSAQRYMAAAEFPWKYATACRIPSGALY